VRFLGDPPIARHAQEAVHPPCKRESEVQVLSRAPIRRVKQAGSCTRLLTDGCRVRGMAFEWSALRQFRKVKCAGAHPRLESEWHPSRVCGSRPTAFRQFGLSSGRRLVSKTGLAGFDSLTARQVIQVWVAGIPAAL
jgi:hypothetical protein